MRFFSRASVVGVVQTLLKSAASVANEAGSAVDGTVAASWPVIYLVLDKLHRRLWGARVPREPGQLLKTAVRALRS